MAIPLDFAGKRIFLAGLIPNSEFTNKTRAINSQFLIVLLGLLLLILMGMPVLKIIFIDPRDRLDAGDSQRASLSMILGTGILALISIGLLKHQVVDRKFQKTRIQEISEKLYSNMKADMNLYTEFYREITGKDTTYRFDLSRLVQDSLNWGVTPSAGKSKNQQSEPPSGNYAKIPKDITPPFPLNEVIVMDSSGIVRKAVTRTGFFEEIPVDVSGRFYFRNTLDTTESWLLKDTVSRENFYIESIKSYNTGKLETAFAFHLKEDSTEKDHLPVLAVTGSIPSFYHQALPMDIGFAVINKEGKVLFHSNRSKNLHENFLDECGNDLGLKTAMDLRIEKDIRIDYNEKSWLANVRPIKDTPLFLVSLLDLEQNQQRNTRIFLFTFYFLIISLLCVAAGMEIIRRSKPQSKFIMSESWMLNWLVFQPRNHMRYKAFLLVLVMTVIAQGAGLFFIDQPVIMLLYQLIFIVYTGIISLIILGKANLNIRKINKKANLPAALIVLILTILILLLFLLQFNPAFFLPLLMLTLASAFVADSVKYNRFDYPKEWQQVKGLPLIPYRLGEKKSPKAANSDEFKPQPSTVRNLYNLCLFLWLLILSVIPVINYYTSVQAQERKLWNRQQMSHLASENLRLVQTFPTTCQSASWFHRIQGNGIDNWSISYCDSYETDSAREENRNTDLAYSLLSDPVTNGDYQMSYLSNSGFHNDWYFKKDTLTLSAVGIRGTMNVSREENETDKNRDSILSTWLLLTIVFLAVILLVWFVLSYVTRFILYSKPNVLKRPQQSSFRKVLTGSENDRVLLVTFMGTQLQQTAQKMVTQFNEKQEENQKINFKPISADALIQRNYQFPLKEKNAILWIEDIDQAIQIIDHHDLLLSKLKTIIMEAKGKIIIALPFNIQYIREYYDDYLAENKVSEEEKKAIYSLKHRWELIFKAFRLQYSTHLKEREVHLETRNSPSSMEPFYRFIWNMTTRLEKLTLYDLAEDGLLNLKNRKLISQLMDKGLIKDRQYPEIFSDGFKNYIRNAVDIEEIEAIESKLTYKGMWHTIRYPIIIGLIVIAAFIFISQGYSFEKITGILVGILTLLATMLRIFSGHLFKQHIP